MSTDQLAWRLSFSDKDKELGTIKPLVVALLWGIEFAEDVEGWVGSPLLPL
jgi:hypothetical protein